MVDYFARNNLPFLYTKEKKKHTMKDATQIRRIYVGIDPGSNGGIAIYSPRLEEGVFNTHKFPTFIDTVPLSSLTTRGIVSHLDTYLSSVIDKYGGVNNSELVCFIEKQVPRPTRWEELDSDTGDTVVNESVLRSTCILYGSYCTLKGILTALNIPYKEVDPKRWQKTIGITRLKGEKDTKWKTRLADMADRIFHPTKVTKAVADALLLCHYGRLITELNRPSGG